MHNKSSTHIKSCFQTDLIHKETKLVLSTHLTPIQLSLLNPHVGSFLEMRFISKINSLKYQLSPFVFQAINSTFGSCIDKSKIE